MPLLGALFINLMSGLAMFLVKYVSQKVAVATAVSLVLGALMLALWAAARIALAGASAAATNIHPMFGAGIAMIVSPRTATLLSAYMTFWLVVELYKWKLNVVQLWSRTI